jgi:very-short-patch-repair endonuclease
MLFSSDRFPGPRGSMLSPDAKIAKIAARQYGVFTHTQALTCGFTQDMIRRRVESGRWSRLHRGVFAISGSSSSLHRDSLAAAYAGDGWVSLRTAGVIWEFDSVVAKGIDIVVAGRRAPRLRGVNTHRAGTLERTDVTRKGVIPITSPIRTLVDLASVLDHDDLEDAFDSSLRRHVTLPALRKRLDRDRHGISGTVALRRLVESRTANRESGSKYENRVRRALMRAGLPEPVRQFIVRDEQGNFVARPDLSYPDARVYIEYDGGDHATPDQLEADNERQNRLSEQGWLPLRFTKGSFKDPGQRIVARVRKVLRSQTRQGDM